MRPEELDYLAPCLLPAGFILCTNTLHPHANRRTPYLGPFQKNTELALGVFTSSHLLVEPVLQAQSKATSTVQPTDGDVVDSALEEHSWVRGCELWGPRAGAHCVGPVLWSRCGLSTSPSSSGLSAQTPPVPPTPAISADHSPEASHLLQAEQGTLHCLMIRDAGIPGLPKKAGDLHTLHIHTHPYLQDTGSAWVVENACLCVSQPTEQPSLQVPACAQDGGSCSWWGCPPQPGQIPG